MLVATVDGPDGSEKELSVAFDAARRKYEVRCEVTLSGEHRMHFTLHGQPIKGSPFPMLLLADAPEILKTTIAGEGISQTKAGHDAVFTLSLLDQYDNVARAGADLAFGMMLIPISGW